MIVITNSSHELMRIYEENISIEQKANETIVKFIPCCILCSQVRFSVISYIFNKDRRKGRFREYYLKYSGLIQLGKTNTNVKHKIVINI